ncbi:MAG: hypothetical protein ACRYFS_17990 [Janthinobacterium lividum]
MIVLLTSGPVFMWQELAREHAVDYRFLPFYTLCTAALDALFFQWSGPSDIYFDREQKTYRHIKGWPFFAKTRNGPLSDLQGVYLRETQNHSYFLVGLTWRSGGSVTLELFSDRMKAEQLAATLMSNLNLERVMPPRNFRSQQ